MFLRNPFETDARVEREARALVAAGCRVTVVALWIPGRNSRRETRDGYRVRRVSRWFLAVDALAALRARRRPAGASGGWMGGDRSEAYAIARSLPGARRLRSFTITLRMVAVGLLARADVFHAHDLNTMAAASWCARIARARLVYDSHELAPGQENVRDPDAAMRRERHFLRRADAVIHTTPRRAAWAAEAYGIEMPTVLLNVPDVEEDLPRADLVARFGFEPGARVLLHQGGMQPNRGLEALVEAMGLLDEDLALALVGPGPLRPRLEEDARRLGITARVRFAGPVSPREVLALAAGAWCGVSLLVDSCPNHRWSLPNKLFEDLAAGIPVVVSDNPEIAEFVANLGVGEVCDPRSAASVAAAVRRLAEPSRYAAARAAAAKAGRRYRWSEESRVLLDLYSRLRERAGAPRSS